MSITPDPTNPERVAIDSDGELVFGVFIAPVGTAPDDPDAWKHAGWTKGFTFEDDPTTKETR